VHQFLKFILGMKLCMFRTVPLSIITSSSLYTQQWYMSDRFADNLRAGSSWSCSQAVSKPVWHIPLLCVQWRTRDDGQRNCPKHAEFHSKNKFEKLVHIVGFIIRKVLRPALFSAVTFWHFYRLHASSQFTIPSASSPGQLNTVPRGLTFSA